MIQGKKGQAFMEVLVTQATSMLILAIVLGSLTIMFKDNYQCLIPGVSIGTTHFLVTDMLFLSKNSSTSANGFYIQIVPKLQETYVVDDMMLSQNNKTCWTYPLTSHNLTVTKDVPLLMNGIMNSNCTHNPWICARYDYEISYRELNNVLSHIERGKAYVVVEELNQPLYSINGWKATNYSTEILKSRNNNMIGSFDNGCPGIPLSNSSDYNVTVATTIHWSIPNGCDNQVRGIGFDKAYCNSSISAKKMASGWLTTNLWVSSLFSGRTLFLVGNATWVDQDDVPRSDGICINDNMYFYLNGQVIAMGGTTGIQSNNNELDNGEEVLKNCGGCSTSSSEGWCVPPINLSGSTSFKTGTNTIHVLLEDICKSGGETNGGGFIPFSFYFF